MVAATECFSRIGYSETRWADVGNDVGLGSTSLYHYYESKRHCLFVIMAQAITDLRMRFVRSADGVNDAVGTLRALLEDWCRLTDREVHRMRVLMAENGLLSSRSTSAREEQARRWASEQRLELRAGWSGFLSDQMDAGAIPRSDSELLTRAILGMYGSIWNWYRPDSGTPFDEVESFYIDRILALLGEELDASAPEHHPS